MTIINSNRNTTYTDVMSNLIDDETVNQIEITDVESEEFYSISDGEKINEALKVSQINLKEIEPIDSYEFTLYLRTESNKTYDLHLNENTVLIEGNTYDVEGKHTLYENIKAFINK